MICEELSGTHQVLLIKLSVLDIKNTDSKPICCLGYTSQKDNCECICVMVELCNMI